MASITEILFRDHRTTLSITKSDDRNSAIPNKSDFNSAANSCDKCQDKSQQKTSSQLKNRALRLKNFRRKSKFSLEIIDSAGEGFLRLCDEICECRNSMRLLV